MSFPTHSTGSQPMIAADRYNLAAIETFPEAAISPMGEANG